MSDADSPVHSRSGPDVRWSRANFAEAIQGVQTPLSWTFWDHVMEICIRRSFGNIGALPASEVRPPSDPDAKVASVFFGLPAGNVDVFHRIGEAMPGTSGAAVVEHLFGERRTASSAAGRGWLRYPIVAGKLPVAAVRSARSLPRLNTELGQWWRHSVIESPPRDIESATLLLRSAAEAFIRVGVQHATVSMIGQSVAEQIEALAVAAWGSSADASTLMTGYGAMAETELMGDVWALAHDDLDIDEFLARHGYHGPDEGNLASTVWREDAGPVKRLAERYRAAEVAHPRAKEDAQLERRKAAEQHLLSSLPRSARAKARVVLRLGRALIPLRESGKASFLRATDGARCSARVLGAHLTAKGFLGHPDDVFFLTYTELLTGVQEPMQAVVQARREDHARFSQLEVPQAWTGNPIATERMPVVSEPVAEPVLRLDGIGVFGEEVSGRARVALDPAHVELQAGEVLVCRTTDPSWTPLFLIAEALVIDTGGAMSHGAIVARELGVPCVINTRTGTRDIPDGAWVTLNGTSGVVTWS